MKLVIGNHQWEVATLNATFPIEFFKKTGIDIFKVERQFEDSPMEFYDMMLNIAFALSGEENLDDFSLKFTPVDLVTAYPLIQDIYTMQSKTTVEAKGEKK